MIKELIQQYNILGIIDREISPEIKRIKEIPVLNIDITDINCFIIVSDYNWDIIVSSLIVIGKQRNKDFEVNWYMKLKNKNCISYEFLINYTDQTTISLTTFLNYFKNNKKIASVFGNCQSNYVLECLLNVEAFTKKYCLIRLPMIAYADKNGYRKEVLENLDLLFYQIVKPNNKFSPKLASDIILKNLKDNCKRYSYPNTYFKGYFPQLIYNSYNPIMIHNGNLPLIPYGDFILDKIFLNNTKPQEIKNIIESNELFLEKDIILNVKQSLNELKNRETQCDVIISDFIEKHYQTEQCFYSQNHPSNEVMAEVTKRLLEKIDIFIKEIDTKNIIPNNSNEVIIYPYVKKVLDLKFRKYNYIFSKFLFQDRYMSVFEYASLYQQFCFTEYKYKKRALDISDKFSVDQTICKVLNISLSIRNQLVSISILFNIKLSCKNCVFMSIPKAFASINSYIIAGKIMNKSNDNIIPILVNNTGEFILLQKDKELTADIYIQSNWHIK